MTTTETRDSDPADEGSARTGAVAIRGAAGGVLMGLANLVPGISGGTMLLAAGIYPRFVQAVAEVSTLRFRRLSLVALGSVVLAAVLAIVLLAGVVKDLVVEQRWVMYSLFIGLTLGGAPVVWAMARPVGRSVLVGALAGFAAMVGLALMQSRGTGAAEDGSGQLVLLFLAGLAGASAMILPGVSGGYLLLVLGQYIPILGAIDDFKGALEARDVGAALDPALHVLVPVGLGVVVGVVAVSNLLRWLLAHHEKATLGVLLGLLLGAVVGLWPFQRAVDPVLGETIIKGRVVTAEILAELEPEGYPTERFRPTAGQVAGSLALILMGLAVTTAVARLGAEEPSRSP